MNHKDLSMRGAREEAKTIDTPAAGSAGQAKRGSRASTSNADLLKQSIRSEKVIKSSLNAKRNKDKSNVAGGQSTTSKNGGGNGNDEQQDQTDSMVKLAINESVDGQAQPTSNDEESKEPAEERSKNLEDVKTVSFHENAGTITTDLAAATSSSAEKPP